MYAETVARVYRAETVNGGAQNHRLELGCEVASAFKTLACRATSIALLETSLRPVPNEGPVRVRLVCASHLSFAHQTKTGRAYDARDRIRTKELSKRVLKMRVLACLALIGGAAAQDGALIELDGEAPVLPSTPRRAAQIHRRIIVPIARRRSTTRKPPPTAKPRHRSSDVEFPRPPKIKPTQARARRTRPSTSGRSAPSSWPAPSPPSV